MHYCYILFSDKLQKCYIGSTDDLKNRLSVHNSGQVPFTSRGKPWQLIYYSAFIEKEDALREEKFLKTGKGRDRRKYLLETFFKNK